MAATLLLLCSTALFGRAARAGTEVLFAGLVPGESVAESELGEYFGKGFEVNVGEGMFNPINTTFNTPEISTIAAGAFGGAEGILQIVQFNGDGNVVNIAVQITVNINSVLLLDSDGNTITSMPVLDFGGTINGVIGLGP